MIVCILFALVGVLVFKVNFAMIKADTYFFLNNHGQQEEANLGSNLDLLLVIRVLLGSRLTAQPLVSLSEMGEYYYLHTMKLL